jgi:hypothetical protein
MAENQKGTVFSRLLDSLRGFRTGVDTEQQKKILTNNPPVSPYSSVEQKQQEFLDVQSSKIAYDLYTRSIYYDTDRLTSYNDFKAMDNSPEISAALDILTDECCSRSEKGEILQIYSNNSRIKNVLKNLFFNSLNINYNLMFWSREMMKFGDCFVKLEVDRKYGVHDCNVLPAAEIHREEAYDGNLNSTRFRWDLNNMYFEEWQIAHFRIATDSARLPYGRSILEPARKLWKQLQLAEDAMLVYRMVRAPERRVYYIEVGNTDPKDVPQYMEKMKAAIKKSSVVDPKTGQVNLKYNPLTYEEDYFLPMRGDKSSKVETLAGASNLNDILDVVYLQDKLFAAIKVPKAYLNYAEKMEGGSTLAQTDLRFARTINRLQEMLLIELRRIANVHLFMLGFQDDMDNFDLKLTNPSTQQELLKLEVMKARLEVFKEMFSNEVTSPTSYTWAMQNILGFSEAEIKHILRQKKVEKKMFAEIEEAAENYKKTGIFKIIDEKFGKGDEVEGVEGEASGAESGLEEPGGLEPGMEEKEEETPELPTGEEETLSENTLLSENKKLFSKTRSLLENLDKKFKDL